MSQAQANMVIDVPQGNGAIKYFKLKPALPTSNAPADWEFIYLDPETGGETSIEDLDVQFSPNSTWLQRQAEQCILVVTIDQSGWRFAMDGTKACIGRDMEIKTDVLHDVDTAISGNGKVLTATIRNKGQGAEFIDFAFVAAHVAENGVTTIYQSADPGIGIRR